MTVQVGYLLPTREGVMEGRHEAVPIVDLAERAEKHGLDSVWIGDSLTARPRHEPIAMLAAIAGRTRRVQMGTAVLLPLLRNPVLLAHQLATLDQLSEGRSIVGIGIGNDLPNIRAEFDAAGVPFDKRVGRLIEMFKLCKELWSGQPVTWPHTGESGRWTLNEQVLGPVPHTPGGPPIWAAGSVPASWKRCARYFDGYFPSGPSDPAVFAERFGKVRAHARIGGRGDGAITGAAYLTLAINSDQSAADAQLDQYLEAYYYQPAARIRKMQGCYTGSQTGAIEWLNSWVEAGASHLCLRIISDHEANIEIAAEMRSKLRSG